MYRLFCRLLSPLTDISILVEAVHQTLFSCSKPSRIFVRWYMASDIRSEWSEIYSASLMKREIQKAKNSVKFIDFAEPQRPHGRPFFRLLGRPYTLLCDKVCGQTSCFQNNSQSNIIETDCYTPHVLYFVDFYRLSE